MSQRRWRFADLSPLLSFWFRNDDDVGVATCRSIAIAIFFCLMTPAEQIIATTFPEIQLNVAILSDRVLLQTACDSDMTYVVRHCDALLPPLELLRTPMTVYLHCEETEMYLEIDAHWMRFVSYVNEISGD